MTFGEAVKDVTNWEIPEDKYLTLKDPKDYKYVGKPIARVDLKAKVFGDPIFGMDAEMDDMLYASVTRPPMVDATLKRCNSSVAEKMPGVVKVVKEKDFVGVVAESRTEANNARLALKCEWNVNKVWQMQDILDIIKVGAGCPYEIQSHGKAKKILDKAEKDGSIIKMEFNSPIGAHAQMEPCGAVAHYKDGKMEVKVSTQVVKLTRDQIADRLGISNDDVNIIPTYLGGGFGKRLQTPTATQTAVLAKAVDKPVKCFLDRKQEFQNDTFRPPTNHLLRAVLDGEGKIEAFEHNVSSGDVLFGSPLVKAPMEMILGSDFGAWRGGMIMYNDIPNFRAVSWRVSLPFATSSWRGLGLLANTFAIESFLDELALTSGKDPIQFRLDMCSDDEKGLRLQTVIREAAERSGYRNNTEDGIAMGFAACIDGNSVCAHVAEVSIVDNEIVVHKVTCVFDCGLVVNPDQVKAQCEGCITMGLSASLYEKMDLVDGVLSPMIYGDYKIAMMRHAPKVIDVVLIEGQSDPLPVGEPPLGPIGAAIGNAVKRLTGKRLTSLPLNLEES
jgi:isoquinoline 1-oxidoreductase beta subunit